MEGSNVSKVISLCCVVLELFVFNFCVFLVYFFKIKFWCYKFGGLNFRIVVNKLVIVLILLLTRGVVVFYFVLESFYSCIVYWAYFLCCMVVGFEFFFVLIVFFYIFIKYVLINVRFLLSVGLILYCIFCFFFR